MSDRPGICPVCNQPFKDGDDVVICPQCGAPYHRACYRQAGECVYSDRHASGFEYKPPETTVQAGTSSREEKAAYQAQPAGPAVNGGGILCKNCQTVNEKANIFCEKCGYPLHSTENQRQPGFGGRFFSGPRPGGPGAFGQGAQGPESGGAPGYGPVYGGAELSGEIEGISKQDWAVFIGSSAPTYLYRMEQLEQQKHKISFMFSAFLLPECYFAYRKMWGWAALALVAELVATFFNVLQRLSEVNVVLLPALSPTMLYTIYYLAPYLLLAIKIASGIFALYLFQRHGTKKITNIREEFGSTPIYQDELRKKGGVSILGVVVCVALILGLFYGTLALAGQDAVSALLNVMMGDVSGQVFPL